ncbi:putative secreted protein (Por secretion system target) [Mesonia algae]|uniref:Putative secreted protein (Por secretion system target) n=1 Tax=Mesonia algae TaxID=213248 RepID=A0A2W7IHI9_9FLAO|nr:T9SS type A sorting domain-containing protein [Mesonia algae]PZW38777.1 putative secreted protein (Por secretion system target) [Mesonia algae]
MKQLYQQSISIKPILLLISLFIGLEITAQTTSIPDQNFEQYLIDEGIDSDGTINGQVLTSDIASVLTLNLVNINDLTGLENFIALEEVRISNGGQPNVNLDIDLTSNSNLEKIIIIKFAGLTNLDITGLINLEELSVSDVSDAPPVMMLDEVDLSTNSNIKSLTLINCFIDKINLKNGNNHNMTNFELTAFIAGPEPQDTSLDAFCAEVDDASAATANMSPYNTWIVYGSASYYDQGECMLSLNKSSKIEVTLFPNPVQNSFQIKTSEEIERVQIFSNEGKKVTYFGSQSKYDISQLPTGMYFVKIQSNQGEAIQRIVKR